MGKQIINAVNQEFADEDAICICEDLSEELDEELDFPDDPDLYSDFH